MIDHGVCNVRGRGVRRGAHLIERSAARDGRADVHLASKALRAGEVVEEGAAEQETRIVWSDRDDLDGADIRWAEQVVRQPKRKLSRREPRCHVPLLTTSADRTQGLSLRR